MSDLFANSDPAARDAYVAVLEACRGFGEVRADEKKASIHLVTKTGFAGVHPRKSRLLLDIRSAAPIDYDRVRKVEQVSANRYHNEMMIGSPADVDSEVVGWLRSAYELSWRKREHAGGD